MLTQEQCDFYEENGYIGVEAVLTAEEVADLQRVSLMNSLKNRERLPNILTSLIWSPGIPPRTHACVVSRARHFTTPSMTKPYGTLRSWI